MATFLPKSFGSNAPLCNTLPSDNLSPRKVKKPALKGLNSKEINNRETYQNLSLVSTHHFWARASKSAVNENFSFLGLHKFRAVVVNEMKTTLKANDEDLHHRRSTYNLNKIYTNVHDVFLQPYK